MYYRAEDGQIAYATLRACAYEVCRLDACDGIKDIDTIVLIPFPQLLHIYDHTIFLKSC